MSNFIIGASYVFSASIVYHYVRTRKGALLGLALGTVVIAIVGALSNYYLIIPFYVRVMGFDIDTIVGMTAEVNRYITDFRSYIILGVIPFNIFKGVSVGLITFFIYKYIKPLLKL